MTYFIKKSQFFISKVNVIPIGDIDGVNLEYILPNGEEFLPETLEVLVDGVSKDPLLDYEEIGTTGFRFIITPNELSGNGMKHPICDNETLRVSYQRQSGASCR